MRKFYLEYIQLKEVLILKYNYVRFKVLTLASM
jgi:hypothetical protein